MEYGARKLAPRAHREDAISKRVRYFSRERERIMVEATDQLNAVKVEERKEQCPTEQLLAYVEAKRTEQRKLLRVVAEVQAIQEEREKSAAAWENFAADLRAETEWR